MKTKISEAGPEQSWQQLKDTEDAVLVDVRTSAEWKYIGTVNLDAIGKRPLFIEWLEYPSMAVNPNFVSDLQSQLGASIPSKIFFLCRSGVRSLSAAVTVAEVFGAQGLETECVNIQEGFEGDLDSDRHRGALNGWKARGLAWRQT